MSILFSIIEAAPDRDGEYPGKDDAERWLAKYTHQNLDRWPPEEYLRILADRYPVKEKITVYRGMHFATEEEWEDFSKSNGLREEGDTIVSREKSVRSWTPDIRSATQFAVTRPSYFLNRDTMKRHDDARNNREHMTGHLGVILSTTVNPGRGIDVNASGLGHESEIIPLPGETEIKLEKIITTHADAIRSGKTTPSNIVLSSSKEDFSDYEKPLEHVLEFHLDKLSREARKHLFKITPKPSDMRAVIKIEDLEPELFFTPGYDLRASGFDKVIRVHVPILLLKLQEKGAFVSEDSVKIKRMARDYVRKAQQAAKSHPNAYWHARGLEKLSSLVGEERKVITIKQRAIGEHYHSLNDKIMTDQRSGVKIPETRDIAKMLELILKQEF